MLVLKTKKDDFDRLAFAPNGQGLVAAGKSGVLWWPSLAESAKPRLFGGGKASTIGISPDGGWVVAVGNRMGVRAYSTADGAERIVQRVGVAYWAAVSPRDPLLVTCHINGRTLQGWELTTGRDPVVVWTAEGGPSASDGTFASDGSLFAHFTFDEKQRSKPERRLVYRKTATGEVIRTVTLAPYGWGGLIVVPGGKCVATFVLGELSVRTVGDEATEAVRITGDGGKHITAAAFHPSGRFLAATSNDTTVKLFDTTSWQPVKTFAWDIGRLRSIAFSPDGLLAAAGSDSGKIVVWDVDA